MTTYLHHPTGLAPYQKYRVDTGATNNTLATITRVDPTTTIADSLVTADSTGAVAAFLGTAGSLYLRPLNYLGTPGTAVTSTGTTYPVAAPGSSAAQVADVDLDALAAIDTTQSGVAATDGTGWALKPYATLRGAIGAAPLASPALTGTPTAPTAAPGTNTTQLATTAHAAAGDAAVVGAAPAWMDTLAKISTSINDDASFAATMTTALAGKQPLNAALTAIAGLSPTDGDLIRRWAGSYISQPVTSVKADMGLDNVTNTSDANKPVSTAQQAALDLKANLASPALTGTPTVPTASTGTNTTQAASAAFVQTELTTAVGRGFRAADQGYVSWSFDTASAQNSSTPTAGSVYLIKLLVPVAVSVTKIKWWVATLGSGATSNQNKVGLFSSAGTLLDSAVVDSDITSTGVKTTTISSQSLSAGFVWVGMVFNASGLPALARSTSLAGAGTNDGLTAATFRHAINGTGQTTLATITPGSNTNGTAFWAAIAA